MRSFNLNAIYHINWLEYRHTLPDGRICLRLRTGKGDFDAVSAHVADMYGPGKPDSRATPLPMRCMWRDDLFDYYQVLFQWADPRIHYYFSLESQGAVYYYDQDGIVTPAQRHAQDGLVTFPFNFAYPEPPKPNWARGCVGYQIFPDRYAREGKHEKGLQKWGSTKVQNHYRFGGNLKGIQGTIPYLKDLGIDMVYLTPIFVSNTSHRYNTFDYYKVDPLLGSNDDLKALCDALHKENMCIVLDGVFNHCGVDFPPFVDAKEKGKKSSYYDWFFFDDEVEGGYLHFGSDLGMPKLNLRNRDAQEYFCDVGRYWIDTCGIDGWRLDVSPEVWPDFWRIYRKAILQKKPEAMMVAECWDDSRQWVTLGDMFDSTMHYVLSRAIWGHFATEQDSLSVFDEKVNRAMMLYPHHVQEVLWNFLGSHDTMRMLTRAGERIASHKGAVFFQMTHPGVPIVYYGDELSMTGGNDPFCRKPMVWGKVEGSEMLAFYKVMIALRHRLPALRYGTFRTWLVDEEEGLYAYLRETDGQSALCLLRTKAMFGDVMVKLPPPFAGKKRLTDALGGGTYTVMAGHIKIPLAQGQGVVFAV